MQILRLYLSASKSGSGSGSASYGLITCRWFWGYFVRTRACEEFPIDGEQWLFWWQLWDNWTFFFSMGLELRALPLLDSYSTTWAMALAIICFSFFFFWIGSCIFTQLASGHDPPTYVSHIDEMIGMYHNARLIGWDGVLQIFFSQADFEPQSSLCLPSK
jgi:hypothetical protein